MEVKMNEKKIRWNIPKAMACVYQALEESKLKIKKTKPYSTAMENLKTLYKLTQAQTWLLCIICERYFEDEDSSSMKDVSSSLKVPVMTIMNWKAERDKLEERGFIEHRAEMILYSLLVNSESLLLIMLSSFLLKRRKLMKLVSSINSQNYMKTGVMTRKALL